MRNKSILTVCSIITCFIIVTIAGCKKDNKEAKPDYSDRYPVIETIPIHDICGIEAQSGGVIISDGGDVVTQRGVVLTTQGTPTIADAKTSNGAGAGSYESLINNLEYSTTYFVRAYATNKWGTGYGNTLSFTTKKNDNDKLPTVYTHNYFDVSFNGATCVGGCTYDGGYPILDYGICFSPNENPTINDIKAKGENTGSGYFEANTTQLSDYTNYHYRAYVTNHYGTAYGEDRDFRTFPIDGTEIKDIDGNIYHTKIIGKNVFLVENLRTTHFNDGTAIPKVEDGAEWSALNTPAYCSYNNNEELAQEYGYLYNAYALINNPGIAPENWRVASYWDMCELKTASNSYLSKHIKEPGTEHWITNGADTDNSTGFTALPGGRREHTGEFTGITERAYIWHIYEETYFKVIMTEHNKSKTVSHLSSHKTNGMSVRLVMKR